MANREWYPETFVDEACPPARATPDDYIVKVDDDSGLYHLGYHAGDEGITSEDLETYNVSLQLGDIVQFMCCDRLDDVVVTFNRNGTYVADGALPQDYNWCRLFGDQDTLHEDIDGLAATVTGQEVDGWVEMNIFAGQPDTVTSQRATVQFARWSDRIPHRFIIKDGKPAFEQVSAASVNN